MTTAMIIVVISSTCIGSAQIHTPDLPNQVHGDEKMVDCKVTRPFHGIHDMDAHEVVTHPSENSLTMKAAFTILLILITCFFFHVCIRLYLKRSVMPPGPCPIPFLGNLLEFIGGKTLAQVVDEYGKKYGGVITIWLGTRPVVFIRDFAMAKETICRRKNDYSGRIKHKLIDDILAGNHDIAFEDFGPQWKLLKKMSIKALRKITDGESIAVFVHESTESTIERMLLEKEAFDPEDYIFNLVACALSSTTFGEKFQLDDPDFLALTGPPKALHSKLSPCLPGYILPVLNPFFEKATNEFLSYFQKFVAVIKKRIESHRHTHKHSCNRDYVDAILSMQEEMKIEDPSQFLTDDCLIGLIGDVFLAGLDATRISLSFCLLMICYYPEVQERIRKEILDNIGDRMPVQDDRAICHYTQAFISELLRQKRTGPFGVPHATIVDTEIGGYKLPSRTTVVYYIEGFHMDETAWDCPNEFKPERFLDSEGRFISSGFSHYMPFGMGARKCVGDKLAKIDIFLVLAGLLQKCKFRLENGPGSASLEMVYAAFLNSPKPYKICIERLNK